MTRATVRRSVVICLVCLQQIGKGIICTHSQEHSEWIIEVAALRVTTAAALDSDGVVAPLVNRVVVVVVVVAIRVVMVVTQVAAHILAT